MSLSDQSLDDFPDLPRPLTAGEFVQPPLELERELGDSWSERITVRSASRPLYWLLAHIRWLEHGRLGVDVYPALCGGGAAASKTSDRERLEAETRNFLRRCGGLPVIRGNVSVFTDCPMARAWWRRRFARRSMEAAASALDMEAAHRSLHRSQPVWEELVRLGVWRVTVINHERTRAALVAALTSSHRESRFWNRAAVADAARWAAREALGHSLDQVEWPRLCEGVARAGEGALSQA